MTELPYRRRVRVRALQTLAALAVAPLVLSTVGTTGGAVAATAGRPIAYAAWDTAAELGTGSFARITAFFPKRS